MSEYERTTRECPVNQLHPELLQAIRDHFREHELGDPERAALACCETISRKKGEGGLLSFLEGEVDSTIHAGLLLTTQWLIWVRKGDQSGVVLSAADQNEIRVRVHKSFLSKDTGLEIAGYISTSKSRARGYVGMGSESMTQRFFEKVQEAIDEVRPPAKTGIARWFSR